MPRPGSAAVEIIGGKESGAGRSKRGGTLAWDRRVLMETTSTLAGLLFLPGMITQEPSPDELPTVLILPASAMPCQCEAAYDDGQLYIRNDINWTDPRWLSIVLHELEHHKQFLKKGSAQGCDEWLEREQRAHAVQTLYLESVASAWRPLFLPSCS